MSIMGMFVNYAFSEGVEDLPKIMEFGDLHLTESLKTAKDTLKGQSGVYCLLCQETGMMYIGSSSDLGRRLMAHILNNNSNVHLQNAIAKYGLTCFVFLVVELCAKDLLLTREQFYLDWLFSLPARFRFNFLPMGSSWQGATHTDEAKAKMSAAKKGSKHSDETKAKMSAAKKGANNLNYGKTARNAQAIYIYSTDKSLIIQLSSQVAAANWLNTSRNMVQRYIKSGELFQNRYYITNVPLIY